MVKDSAEVIKDFNEIVNMSAEELKEWAGTEESQGAGWTGGNDGGETVGHESAMKIINILKDNPDKVEDKYTDEHIQHMRKVVAYCKRHLAQESHMVDEKSEEQLEKTKSYKSLKNWGHDSLKVKHSNGNASSAQKETKQDKPEKKQEKEQKEKDEKAPETGDKRKVDETKDEEEKRSGDAQEPESKKSKENPEKDEKKAGGDDTGNAKDSDEQK